MTSKSSELVGMDESPSSSSIWEAFFIECVEQVGEPREPFATNGVEVDWDDTIDLR